jgi:VWFA-related protein
MRNGCAPRAGEMRRRTSGRFYLAKDHHRGAPEQDSDRGGKRKVFPQWRRLIDRFDKLQSDEPRLGFPALDRPVVRLRFVHVDPPVEWDPEIKIGASRVEKDSGGNRESPSAPGRFQDAGVRNAYTGRCSRLGPPRLRVREVPVFEILRVVSLALLAVLSQAQATPTPAPSPQQPRFRGGTNLVRVDAFATKGSVPVQDLTADDFEIFEDNTPQKIDTFEHVVIEPARPGERVDPSSASQAIQMAADPHRRVFVVYLDIEHVDYEGSHNIKEPLIDFMNRVMDSDDLVGLMTPDMGPQQITFGRKTDVIERGLRDNWIWGRRDSIIPDDREKLYQECFPPLPGESSAVSALAREMTLRRREKMVLDSLYDLAHYMEAIRDGRTAVITVSDGWVLYGPNPSMTAPRPGNIDPLPGAPPPVGVGPGGRLMPRPTNGVYGDVDRTECDKDRFALANLDDPKYLRDLFGDANRANISFYTIDPRGLVAFDAPIGPDQPPSLQQDLANLNARHGALQDLAVNTDGRYLLNSNDLRGQLRKVADDLTSYYLLGYYSTNPKLDGKFRVIKVRSKRPGVEVRARHGYLAATAAEVNKAKAASDVIVPEEKAAVARALGTIETDARAQGRTSLRGGGEPLVFHRGPSTGNQMQPAAGRIFPRSERIHIELEAQAGAPIWTGALLDRNGGKTAVPIAVGERADAATGQRWLTADVTLAPLGAGDYVVELTSTVGTEQKRTLVAIRVTQ